MPVTGIKTTGVISFDQPRVLDFAARQGCQGRKVGTLPDTIMEEVLARVATLFE